MSAGHAAILGWAGSTERQLRVVARWYEQRGFTPLLVAPRVFRAMALPWGWRAEGEAVRARLAALDGPLVVHLFSNAGFWTYAAMLRAASPSLLDRICAAVIDSAPGFPERLEPSFTARHAAMAMMPIVLSRLGRAPALSHPLLDPPMRAFMRLWYFVSPLQIRAAEESLEVVRTTGRWPLLVLYSGDDSLVPAELVARFVRSVEPVRPIDSVRFEGSEHVRHMITHRHAYFDAVAALLGRVAPGP